MPAIHVQPGGWHGRGEDSRPGAGGRDKDQAANSDEILAGFAKPCCLRVDVSVAADHHVHKGETVTTTSSSADRRPANDLAPRRRVAVVAAVGFLIIASFQVALAFGAPLGAAAFGGANAGQLPQQLRICLLYTSPSPRDRS